MCIIIKIHNIKYGTSFPRELSEAVAKQDNFLVLLTEAAINSNWVQDEIEKAIALQQNIIPIRVNDTAIPSYLINKHYLQMTDGVNDWLALHNLVNNFEGGKDIPRVYNISGHKDIEVKGILVLDHCDFGLADLSDPASAIKIAQKAAKLALPFIKKAGAGIVPHGHSALACTILAFLLGALNQMPKLYYTHKFDSGKFGIAFDKFVKLQDVRDKGFEYRSKNL